MHDPTSNFYSTTATFRRPEITSCRLYAFSWDQWQFFTSCLMRLNCTAAVLQVFFNTWYFMVLSLGTIFFLILFIQVMLHNPQRLLSLLLWGKYKLVYCETKIQHPTPHEFCIANISDVRFTNAVKVFSKMDCCLGFLKQDIERHNASMKSVEALPWFCKMSNNAWRKMDSCNS